MSGFEQSSQPRPPGDGLARHAGVTGAATLTSRILGLVRDHVCESARRQLPVRTLVPEVLGERDRAAQRMADRRRTGEQGERPWGAVGMTGPDDLAAGALQVLKQRLEDPGAVP